MRRSCSLPDGFIAWLHLQKQVRYSDVNADDVEVDIAPNPLQHFQRLFDCFNISHYYAEFNFSSTTCLLAAGGARDDDETEEAEVSDIDSSHLGDVFSE